MIWMDANVELLNGCFYTNLCLSKAVFTVYWTELGACRTFQPFYWLKNTSSTRSDMSFCWNGTVSATRQSYVWIRMASGTLKRRGMCRKKSRRSRKNSRLLNSLPSFNLNAEASNNYKLISSTDSPYGKFIRYIFKIFALSPCLQLFNIYKKTKCKTYIYSHKVSQIFHSYRYKTEE
jgi:hypothetical protein